MMLLNCGVREDSWEFLGQQGDQTSQSWRGINTEYSLEGLMLELKLQYFGLLMQRANSLEKTLMVERLKAGGEVGNREWDGQMASPWVNPRRWWRTGKPGVLQLMGSQSWTWLSNWTTATTTEAGTAQMSLGSWADKQNVFCPYRGRFFSIKRTEILVCTVIWMNLKNMPEEARKEKITFYMIAFIWIVQSRQIYGDHWQVAGGWEQE